MSDTSVPVGVTTRSRNATVHPGLVDATSKRTSGEKTKKELAEEKKRARAEKKQEAIRKIGEVEKKMADDEMIDVTPGPRARANRYQTGRLQHSKSSARLPLTEDAESLSSDAEGTNDTGHTASINADITENEPPKKKAKTKKTGLRDSVTRYIEQERSSKNQQRHDDVGTKVNKGRQEGGRSVDTRDDLDDEEMDIDEPPPPAGLQKRKLVVVSDDDDETDAAPEPKSKNKKAQHVNQNVSNGTKQNRSATIPADRHTIRCEDWVKHVPGAPKLGSTRSSTPSLMKNAPRSSQSVASRSVTSRSVASRSALNKVVIRQRNDNVIGMAGNDGPLSDRDEVEGPEREAAIRSPPKGKKRVTSSGIVKLQNSPKPVIRSRARTSKRPTNDELPKEWVEDGAWRKVVIPTLFRWASAQPNPWTIPDAKIIKALETICGAVFGDSEVPEGVITPTSTAVRLALQRLSDSWRSVFGSCAIAIVNAFFEVHDEYRDSDEMRQEFARHLLDKLRFIYRKANGNEKRKFKGPFCGNFIIQTFAAHFNAIKGSKSIHGLFDEGESEPRAALALATTAVERALTLYAHGAITVETVSNAKASKKAIKLPATINLGTGRESARHVAFSYVGWNDQTSKYLISINKVISKPAMDNIMAQAKEFSQVSMRQADEGDSDSDDERANIAEGSGSSDESDQDVNMCSLAGEGDK